MTQTYQSNRRVIFAPGMFSWTNKGDAALVLSFLSWIEGEFQTGEIILTSFTPTRDSEYFNRQVIEMVTRPNRRIHRLGDRFLRRLPSARLALTYLRFARLSCVLFLIPLWAKLYRRNANIASLLAPAHVSIAADAIAQSSLVVTVPGGYLNALRATNDWWLFHVPTLALAKALGKTIVLSPCSIGPFDRRHESRAKRTLKLADVVMVREKWSYEECIRLQCPPSKVFETADMAFWFASEGRSQDRTTEVEELLAGRSRKALVGVSVREHNFPGSANPRAEQRKYLDCVALALGELQRKFDAQILIIPQTMEDISTGEDLANRLKARGLDFENIQSDLSPIQLQDLYGSIQLLVGTRMHANILAMCAGTPVAAIAYEPKTLGILRSMGLSDWGLAITDLGEDRLTQLVERQWLAAPELAKVATSRAAEQSDRIDDAWAAVAHLI